MAESEKTQEGAEGTGGAPAPASGGAEAARGGRRHPWHADGTPAAVYALVKRYREETRGDLEPRVRALLLYEIGRLFEEHLGDPKQAGVHFREALDADPDCLPALRSLRRQASEGRSYAAALELLDREIAGTPEGKARAALHRERALLLDHRLGRAEEARAAYEEARRGDPGDGMALRVLASAARRRGDWVALREALAAEEERAGSSDLQRAIRFEIARLDEDLLGRVDDAETCYRRMLEVDPADREARESLRRVVRRAGRWKEYVDLLVAHAAEAESGVRSQMLYEAARAAVDHLGDADRARAILQDALQARPEWALALRELLRLYEEAGKWEEAAASARALAERSADAREKLLLLHRLGLLLSERLERAGDAVGVLRQALTIDGTAVPVLQALGDLLARLGRWEELCAMHLQEAQVQDSPERKALAYCRAAEVWDRRLDRPEESIKDYEAALAARPGYAPALRALEILYRRVGLPRSLADLYGKLAEAATEPSLKVAYLERQAVTLESAVADVDGAATAYEAILALAPDHAAACAALMRIHEERKEWEKLVGLLRRLAERDRTEEGALAHLLRAAEIADRELGDPSRALAELEAALAVRPNALPVLQAAGRILHREGRWDELVALYRRELEVVDSPTGRAAVLCRIGSILEERIGDPDRARDAYQAAVSNDPSCAPALQALLRLHTVRGDMQAVIGVLEAEATASQDPGRRAAALERIGEIWEDPLGKPELALDAYVQALQLDPASATARAAQERLLSSSGAWERLAELRGMRAAEIQDPDAAFRAWVDLGFLWNDKVANPARGAECFRKALEIRPAGVVPLRALAEIHAATSAGDALAATVDKLAEVLPSGTVRLGYLRQRLLEAERAGTRPELRARLVDEIRRLAPTDGEAALLRESLALQTADAAALAAVLESLLPPDDAAPARRAAALHRLADCKARLGRLEEAEALAQRAVEVDPASLPAVCLWTSLVEAVRGKIGADHLRRLAGVSRDKPARCTYLVHAAEELAAEGGDGKWEEAVGLLGEALRECPGSIEAMGAVLRLHGRRQAWDRLAATLRGIAEDLGDRPEVVEVLYMLATVQRDHLGDRREAMSTLNRILRLSPTHIPALTDLGDLCAEADLFNEAIAIYRQILRADADEPSAAQAAVRLSVLLEDKLQDASAARKVLDETRARFPRAPAVLERLIVHLRRDGCWREARDILDDLIARDDLASSRTGYRLLLAELILEGYEDESEAVAVLREAAASETGTSRAVARLIRLWSDRGRWTDVADLLEERLAAAGHNLDAGHAPLLLELAKVCAAHLHDLPRAIAAQERAVTLDRDNRAARLRLAELQAQAGNVRSAVGLARGILAEDPLDRKAHRILFDAREVVPRVGAAAAQVLRCLGDADAAVESVLAQRRPRAAADLEGLTLPASVLRTLLPPAAAHPAVDVLALVSSTVGVLFATDIETHGASKRDRIGGRAPAGGSLVGVIEAVASAVGLEDIPAYLASVEAARGVLVEPEARPVVVIPRALADAPVADQIFHLGRAMGKIALGLHLVDKLSPADLAALLAALVGTGAAGASGPIVTAGVDEERVAELARRLERDLPRRIRRSLEPLVWAYIERPLGDPAAFMAGVEQAADRIGLVMSDAVDTAARFAARRDAPDAAAHDLREALRVSPAGRDLLRFAVSEEREAVGL